MSTALARIKKQEITSQDVESVLEVGSLPPVLAESLQKIRSALTEARPETLQTLAEETRAQLTNISRLELLAKLERTLEDNPTLSKMFQGYLAAARDVVQSSSRGIDIKAMVATPRDAFFSTWMAATQGLLAWGVVSHEEPMVRASLLIGMPILAGMILVIKGQRKGDDMALSALNLPDDLKKILTFIDQHDELSQSLAANLQSAFTRNELVEGIVKGQLLADVRSRLHATIDRYGKNRDEVVTEEDEYLLKQLSSFSLKRGPQEAIVELAGMLSGNEGKLQLA